MSEQLRDAKILSAAINVTKKEIKKIENKLFEELSDELNQTIQYKADQVSGPEGKRGPMGPPGPPGPPGPTTITEVHGPKGDQGERGLSFKQAKISEEKVVWRPDFLSPGKLRSINPATVATDLKVLFIKALPESHLSRPNSISSELNSSVGFSTFLSPHRRVA